MDTAKESGTEMMPFSNIFNEWYAAQLSKKIRAVNQIKTAKGQRVSSAVPYGYMKSPDDKQKWLIDEPSAEIVRKIFNLCLAGKEPSQIARQLEKEKILTPTAYYHSISKKTSNPMPANVYGWRANSIDHILENRQYTGYTVNGKSTTVSYKVHKVIEKSKEEQFVYCADCGAKLHFCAAKRLKKNQEFFRCANYKDGRSSCSIHCIREVVLETIALVENSERELAKTNQATVDMKMLSQGLREFTDMKELTPTVVNKLIQRIEFQKNEKKLSHNNVNVDIYFTAVGLVDIPAEQQLLETIQKIKEESTAKSA